MPPVKPPQRTHLKDEPRSQVIPSDVTDTMNEIKDGLNTMFDDSVKRVKGTADKIEHHYVAPFARVVGNFAAGSPVVFTFLVFFSFFSVVPLLVAVGILTFATSVLLATLLGLFAFAVTVMLLIAGAILTPILAFTAFLSFLATAFLVGSFLATRLYLCISKAGFSDIPGGVIDWMQETRLRLLLTLGLDTAGRDTYPDFPETEANDERILVTQILVPAQAGGEIDAREEDERTEVGYRESPERVKLEIFDVHGDGSIAAEALLANRLDVNDGSVQNVAPHQVKSEHHSAGHLAQDEESVLAQEVGV